MTPQLSQTEIHQITNVINKYTEVEQAILFGSRATGEAKPNSDIDICLRGKDISHSIKNSITSELDELPLPYFFDVINFDTITTEKLKDHILNFGINLLQASLTN